MTNGADTIQRCPVLGTNLYAGGLADAADLVIDRAMSRAGGYVTLTGVHGVTMARGNADVRIAFEEAWMNFPDGAPVAWRQRRSGISGAERVGGPDLMPLVLDRGVRFGLRHFLLGSTPRVLNALEGRVTAAYPGVRICGSLSPPFRPLSEDDDREIAAQVLATGPDIVWVGLGAPKQDLWCHRNAGRLQPALCVAVGAAFDFLAGTKRRAPAWMRRSGLEWAHRLVRDPLKLGPRYLRANSQFVALTAAELVAEATFNRRSSA